MKIIFVSNLSWNLFNFRLGLMKFLKGRGHEVLFCAPQDPYTEQLKGLGFRFIAIKVDRKGTNLASDFLFLLRLLAVYMKEKPGLVLHYTIKPNIYGSIAAKLSGTRCVNTVSGLGFIFISKGLYFNPVKLLYSISSRFCEYTFFHNHDDLSFFVKNKIISSGKAVLVKGSGINADFFAPVARDNGEAAGVFKFLFIGRLLWDKGILEFVESARVIKQRYPDVKFLLLGPIDKGNPAVVPEEKINSWQSQGIIEYLGEVCDVRPVVSQSDCVVLPSYREGAPRALLEAASMEKPVIATDTPGCREVVDHGINGFLVKVKDAQGLAEAMLKIIELPEDKRAIMGRKGREKVLREFDEKRVIEEYSNVLKI